MSAASLWLLVVIYVENCIWAWTFKFRFWLKASILQLQLRSEICVPYYVSWWYPLKSVKLCPAESRSCTLHGKDDYGYRGFWKGEASQLRNCEVQWCVFRNLKYILKKKGREIVQVGRWLFKRLIKSRTVLLNLEKIVLWSKGLKGQHSLWDDGAKQLLENGCLVLWKEEVEDRMLICLFYISEYPCLCLSVYVSVW